MPAAERQTEKRRKTNPLTVAFHFAEAETSVAAAALERLARQLGDGTTRTRVNLVVHLQTKEKNG